MCVCVCVCVCVLRYVDKSETCEHQHTIHPSCNHQSPIEPHSPQQEPIPTQGRVRVPTRVAEGSGKPPLLLLHGRGGAREAPPSRETRHGHISPGETAESKDRRASLTKLHGWVEAGGRRVTREWSGYDMRMRVTFCPLRITTCPAPKGARLAAHFLLRE